MTLYFYLHIFTISFPLLRSFEDKIKYASKWRYLFPAIFITALFFLIWDIIFTQNGIWGFDKTYLLGLDILGLPIEEWLFFLTVPFASVFIYECVLYFVKENVLTGYGRKLLWAVGIGLVVVGFFNYNKAYTFWNFEFTGFFIVISLVFLKPPFLDRFIVAFVIHLVPFLLVNGILTGAVTENPIVWYNDEQNLDIKVYTIPIEDIFYALLLLFMNVSIYEYFKRNKLFHNFLKG